MELCALTAREGGEASQHTAREPSAVTTVEGLSVVVGSDMGVEQHEVPVPP